MPTQIEGIQRHLGSPWARVLMALVMLVLAAALLSMMTTQTLFQWSMRLPFPFWDMFRVINLLDARPDPDILYLFQNVRDNEHKPIVPFLFYIWDRVAAGDTGGIIYPALLSANALLALSCMGFLAVRGQLNIAAKILLAAIIGLAFFSIRNFENLTWQKQIHEILSVLFLSLALLAAASVSTASVSTASVSTAHGPRHGRHDLGLAALVGVFGLAGTYCFGFGLVVWPVVVLHALLARWRRLPLGIVLLFAVFSSVTYYFAYISAGSLVSPVTGLLIPWEAVTYIPRVLVAVFPFPVTSLSALLVGVGGLIVAAGACFHFYRERYPWRGDTLPPPRTQVEHVVASHAVLLIMASLVMLVLLSLGRLQFTNGQVSRYMIVSFVFWCALLILLVHVFQRRFVQALVLAAGVVAAVSADQAWRQLEPLVRQREQSLYASGVMATWRIPRVEKLPALYRDDAMLFNVWHRERPPFQSFAARVPFGWIGADLASLPGVPDTARCLGHVEKVVPRPGDPRTIQLHGWAFMAGGEPLRWLVVTGLDNRGLGVGKPGLRREDVRAVYATRLPDASAAEQEHSGFILAAVREPGQPVLLWGIDDSGHACKITGPID
jgi:hypothetical protein